MFCLNAATEDNSDNNVNTLNLTRLLLLTTLLFTANSVFAIDTAKKLEADALKFLHEHYIKTSPNTRAEIKINPISRKIKLKACPTAIEFQTPRGNSRRITFKAKCPSLWQLFIAAEIKLLTSAVVSRSPLPRKTVIQTKDLAVKEVDITGKKSDYFTDPQQINGWTSKRNIATGALITANMLTPPLAVRKGDALIIEAKRSGVTIRTTGTALQPGSIGEQISVKNDRSGNLVKGFIVEPGLVRVP